MLKGVVSLTICCFFLIQSVPGNFSPIQPSKGAAVNPAKWDLYDNNPVLTNGSADAWDGYSIWPYSVLYEDNKYWMYYTGMYMSPSAYGIGLAFSTDGINWEKYSGNPIITDADVGSWDEGIISPMVIKDGSTFKMWYEGINDTTTSFGYATSDDGINWTKYGSNPVFTNSSPGNWDDSWLDKPWVIKENSEYKMWYLGFNQTTLSESVGYANSTDGINWTRYDKNPILTPSQQKSWDDQYIFSTCVLNVSSKYMMWYSADSTFGVKCNIGYATSDDGLSWTKYAGNPVMDDVYYYGQDRPVVYYNGTDYQMWYTRLVGGDPHQIGYAIGRNQIPKITGFSSPQNDTWISNNKPSFSWSYSDPNNDAQTAYQIQLDDDSGFSSINYDTGKVGSSSKQYTSATAYADGIYYYRVKVWDDEDESVWSATRVLKIDTTAPNNPTTFESSSHAIDSWSSDKTIDLTFSGAYDAGCGIAGYSVLWDYSSNSKPDTTQDIDCNQSNSTSPSMSDSGSIYFHIRTIDNLSQISDTTHYGPFKIDATAPTNPTITSSTHKSGSWSNISSVAIKWTGASDASSGIQGYSIDWDIDSATIPDDIEEFDSSADSTTSPGLSEGDWYFHIRTFDNTGNSATGHFGPIRIDVTPPLNPVSLSSTSHTTGVWSNDSTIDIQVLGADDALSGIDGYSILWDNFSSTEPNGTKNIGNAGSFSSPILADNGTVYLHLRTVDKAGNPSADSLHLGPFKLDSTPPDSPELSSASHNVSLWSNISTVDINWTGMDGSISGIAGYSFLWDLNKTAYPDAVIGLPANATNATSPPLEDGNWYFHLGICDNAGNWAFSDMGPFRIDTLNPGNPLNLQSTSHFIQKWSNDTTIDLSWSGAAGGLSGVLGYSYCWDDLPNTIPDNILDCYSSISSMASPALTDGNSHYFHLRTVDNAGNWNSTAVNLGPFWIDSTPPASPACVTCPSHLIGKWSNISVIDVQWELPPGGADICGYAGYSIVWDAFNNTTPDLVVDLTPNATNTTSPKYQSSGKIFIHIRAIDNAGNAAETVHLGPFRIDTTPPTNPLDLMSPNHYVSIWSTNDTVEVIWSMSDASISGVEGYSYAWDNEPNTLPIDSIMLDQLATSTLSPQLTSRNDWYFHLRTKDFAGYWANYAASIGPFYIDTISPTIRTFELNHNNSFSISKSIEISISAVDNNIGSNVSSMRFREGGKIWSSWEKITNSKTIILAGQDGTYSIDAQVMDNVGNPSAIETRSIMIDTNPPSNISVTINDESGYTNSTSVLIKVSASDFEPSSGGLVFCACQKDCNWSSWFPLDNMPSLNLTSGDGQKSILVRVKDRAGNIQNASPTSILLDTISPKISSIIIGNGSDKSSTLSVSIQINAKDSMTGSGLRDYSISSDGLAWGDWTPYSERINYTLPIGDGTRSINCRVRDWALNFAESVKANILIDTAPPIILNAMIVKTTSTSAIIEWSTDEPTTGNIEYGINNAFNIQSGQDSFTNNHITILKNLELGLNYQARIEAWDICGNREKNERTLEFITSKSSDTSTPSISGLTVLQTTDKTALLEWETNEPAECAIEYGRGNDFSQGNSIPGFGYHHLFLLTSLNIDSNYQVRVKATDASGNGPGTSDVIKFHTGLVADAILPNISDISVSGITDSSAIIYWRTDEYSTGFVQTGISSDYNIIVSSEQISYEHSVIIKGLTPGTNYHFKIGAIDISGNGPAFSSDDIYSTGATSDTIPPIIEKVKISKIDAMAFTMEVELNEPGIVCIYIEKLPDCSIYVNQTSIGFNHTFKVSGLQRGSTYKLQVFTWDISGNGPTTSEKYNVITLNSFKANLSIDFIIIFIGIFAVILSSLMYKKRSKNRNKSD